MKKKKRMEEVVAKSGKRDKKVRRRDGEVAALHLSSQMTDISQFPYLKQVSRNL